MANIDFANTPEWRGSTVGLRLDRSNCFDLIRNGQKEAKEDKY
jgi:hypothetical protein